MSNCEAYWDLISYALDGALTPEERTRLEEHLAVCPDCRALLEQMQAMQGEMPGVEEAPAGFAGDVMAAVAETEQDIPFTNLSQNRDIHKEGREQVRAWWKPIKHWGAIAACCLVILGLGTMASRSGLLSSNNASSGSAAPPQAQDALESESCAGGTGQTEPEDGVDGKLWDRMEAEDSVESSQSIARTMEINGEVYVYAGTAEYVSPEWEAVTDEADGVDYYRTEEPGVVYLWEDGILTRWERIEE